MANIRMRFKTPDTGEYVSGRVTWQLRPLPTAKPLVDGQDAIITAPVSYDVSTDGITISTRPTPFGWYYHVSGTTDGGWKFYTNVYVPDDNTYDLDELVTLDPKQPFSFARPEPVWWDALNQLTDIYAEGYTDAANRAETAATAAHTARTGAETARTGAQTARTQSQNARDEARSARDAAETASSSAQTSASNSQEAASNAILAAGHASGYADDANDSAASASSSQQAAESARDESVSARDAAVTARNQAQQAASEASDSAQDASQSAQNAAQSESNAADSETAAEGYRNDLADIVDQAVADGFPLATENSAGLMSAADKVRLTSQVADSYTDNVTVRIPTDYPTLQNAINEVSGSVSEANKRITLSIETGHLLTHGLTLKDGDYSRFWITSDDSVVSVAADFSPVSSAPVSESNTAIFYFENCRAPVLNCLIDAGGGRTFDGLIAFRGAHVDVQPGCGIKGTRMNLEVRNGTVSAQETVWSNASRGCIRMTEATIGSISGAEAHDGWTNPPAGQSSVSASVHISRSSVVQCQRLKIDRSGFRAISVRRSWVFLDGTVIGSTGLSGGSAAGAISIMSAAYVILGTTTFNGNPITPAACGVVAFNVPGASGTVYSESGPNLITVNDSGNTTSTTISNRLVVTQHRIDGLTLNNPDVLLNNIGPQMVNSSATITPISTGWMSGSGFTARMRAVNHLVIGSNSNTIRIRMDNTNNVAVDETINVLVTLTGRPVT